MADITESLENHIRHFFVEPDPQRPAVSAPPALTGKALPHMSLESPERDAPAFLMWPPVKGIIC